MIYLNNNQSNSVALSLSNNVTITGSSVYFLFEFKNGQTGANTYFTAADKSTNVLRYNLFDITLTGSSYTNLTAGTIHLTTNGWYDYNVYQMTGQTNLSLSGVTGGAIERGKVLVSGTTIPYGTTYTYTGQTDTKTVYYQR